MTQSLDWLISHIVIRHEKFFRVHLCILDIYKRAKM